MIERGFQKKLYLPNSSEKRFSLLLYVKNYSLFVTDCDNYLFFFFKRKMVYDNRGYEDDEFVSGTNGKNTGKRTATSPLEFTRNLNKIEVNEASKNILIMATYYLQLFI